MNIWQKGNTAVSGDEKPDLLEYNSTNPDFDSNGEEYHSQLPDLTTSVRAVGLCNNNYNIDSLSNSLDLISSASVNLLKENEQVKHDLVDCEGDDSYRDYDEPNSQFYQDTSSSNRDVSNLNNELAEFADALQSRIIPEMDSERPVEFDTSEKAQALNLTQHLPSEMKDSITARIPEEISTQEALEESQILIGDKEVADENPRVQVEAFDIPKAVGFSVDSDVSEGDLEEYLKELEDLDETALLESNATCNTEVVNSCCESTCDDQVELNFNGSKILSNICMENKISDPDSSKTEYEVDNNYRTNNTGTQIIDPGLKDHDKNYSENAIHHLLNTDSHSSVNTMSLEKNNLLQNTTSSSVYSQEINKIVSLDFKFENNLGETSVNIVTGKDLSQPKHSSNTLTDSNCENPSVEPTSNKDDNRVTAVVSEIISKSFEVEGKEVKTESTGHKSTTSTNPFEDEDGDNTINEEKLKMQSTNPFDEDVDEGFSREESVSELSVEPTLQICPQHPGEVCEAERAFIDPNAGQDTMPTEPNTTSEIGTEVTVCSVHTDESQDPPSYSDVIKASGSSYSSSTVELGETASALSLPGCSGSYKSLETSAKMIPVKAAVESPSSEGVDEAGVPAEEDRPLRPSSLELQRKITVETSLAPSPDLSGIGFDTKCLQRSLSLILV